MSLRGKIASVALTDTGKVREHNEDMIGTEADIGLFVLADGMGGYNAGEVASGIAVKTIINLVRDAQFQRKGLLSVRDPETGLSPAPASILRDAVIAQSQQNHLPHLEDPKASNVRAWVRRWWHACFTTTRCRSHTRLAIRGFTGCATTDSRANDPGSLPLAAKNSASTADSIAQQEAQQTTNKNYVTRALRVEQNVEVEIHEQPVQKSDYYVLCSDGLSDMRIEDRGYSLNNQHLF